MQLSLRPYVTTGVALVGASVIAAAPLQPVVPAEIQIANPAAQAVERGVQLTANEIQTAVNNAIFNFVARPTVASAELLGRLLEPLIGEEQAFLLPLAALGFAGPLISGGGSVGTALQEIVDSDGFDELVTNLIGALGTITDGSVNGGYGPNLAPLVAVQVAAVLSAQLSAAIGMPVVIPPQAIGTVLAGGIISEGGLLSSFPPLAIPISFELPGPITTLQGLVEQLFGLVGGSNMASEASLMAAPPPPPQPIEDGVNRLTYALVSATIPLIARILTPVLGPLLPPSPLPAELVVTGLLLGLSGPLISGPGAAGAALQDVADALGSRNPAGIVNAIIGAPATVLDGVVNGGGLGPDLNPLLGNASPLPVRAGGLIGVAGLLFNPPSPAPVGVSLPGTIPTLQQLVGGLLGDLAPNPMVTARKGAPAGNNLEISGLAGGDQENSDDDKVVDHKRNRPLLNLVRHSLGADEGTANKVGADSGTSGKHRIGTPVRDLINKVVNGGRDNGDDDDKDEATKDEPSDPK